MVHCHLSRMLRLPNRELNYEFSHNLEVYFFQPSHTSCFDTQPFRQLSGISAGSRSEPLGHGEGRIRCGNVQRQDFHQKRGNRSDAGGHSGQSRVLLSPEPAAGELRRHNLGPGFSTQVQTGITLTVGAQQVLNITMQIGQVTEKVEVTGEAPAVQLATLSLGAVVNSTTVKELPLNGRSWADLATLQPGVAAIETQADFSTGIQRRNRGFANQITVSGARPQWNNYRLDGVSINDYSNGGPGSVLGGNLGVDAIQEFSVITSNYSAEYGRTSGGVVNAITRSGTNQFHGSVYEFLRNSDLDARNFFDVTVPPFRRNQFGAAAGGPVRKDKLFVFGDYEGIRQSKGITALETVPQHLDRAGAVEPGFLRVQRQLHQAPLGDIPRAVPGRVFQYLESAELQLSGETRRHQQYEHL